jgi:DNA repair protein RadC
MEIRIQDHKVACTNPEQVAHLFQEILLTENEVDQDKEHFWVMGLNTRHNVKYVELVSLGTLDNSLVEPRETFRMAILKGVKSIIVAHNHPSGIIEPSQEDLALCRRLRQAGHIIGIEVLDHVIVSKGEYYSFANAGLI